MKIQPRGSGVFRLGETWLESEDFCYSGGRRRCRAAIEGTAHYRIFHVGFCDTFFSIPARLDGKRGFIHMAEERGFTFSLCTESI